MKRPDDCSLLRRSSSASLRIAAAYLLESLRHVDYGYFS
jgi:hypothetical protein